MTPGGQRRGETAEVLPLLLPFLPFPCCSFNPGGGNGLRQQVAVKQLKPEVLKGAQDLKEFLMEGNLQRKLKHK